MSKVIVFSRVSTDKQEIDNQISEMIEFVRNEGYSDDDIVLVERRGASAIKLDDDYLEMIEDVKDKISDDGDIDCFAVWSLNRAFRNEKVYADLKDFLVRRKVQLLVKNPYLKLLNPDGSVNRGMELAVSLLSTLAKQEMEEKLERFKRTKKANAIAGKWSKNVQPKFGYHEEGGYLVPFEEEAKVVRLIFELYASGYTSFTLAEELNERGYDYHGKPFNYNRVNFIIRDRSYVGENNDKDSFRTYKRIVSDELFLSVEKRRKENRYDTRMGTNRVLCSKLIICPVCGTTFCGRGHSYCCSASGKFKNCPNNISLNRTFVDTIVWAAASNFHLAYLVSSSMNDRKVITERIGVLRQKMNTSITKLDKVKEKKERAVESFVEGIITKQKRDDMISRIDSEMKESEAEMVRWQEEISRLEGLLVKPDTMPTMEELVELGNNAYEDIVFERMYQIVHQHIKKIVIERYPYKGRRAFLFNIYTFLSDNPYQMVYFPMPLMKMKYYLLKGNVLEGVVLNQVCLKKGE